MTDDKPSFLSQGRRFFFMGIFGSRVKGLKNRFERGVKKSLAGDE
jgi:hypothetical protein